MGRATRSAAFVGESLLAAATAGFGAFAAGASFQDSGFTSVSMWIVAFAGAGLVGLAILITGVQRSSAHRVVLGLVLAALSPTVFLYPLNLLVLLAAAAEGAAILLPARTRAHT
jgi:hypothetical protein